MSINNQNSSVIKQPNLIKKPKVETVEENEMSFYAQPVETEKSDKNSSKQSVQSRRKEEPRVEPATSPPKRPVINSGYYTKYLPLALATGSKFLQKGLNLSQSINKSSLINPKIIKFKQHKMELVAHLHHTKSILKNLNQNPEYEDYTILKPKMGSNQLQLAKLDHMLKKQPQKKLLILDLDETLIHVSKATKGSAFTIPIKLRNGSIVRVSLYPTVFEYSNLSSLECTTERICSTFYKKWRTPS